MNGVVFTQNSKQSLDYYKQEDGSYFCQTCDYRASYKKDFNGEVVITKLNKDILETIAQTTGGVYQNGNNTKEVLDFVSEQLKAMDKKEFEAKKFVSYKDRFQAFLIAALFFLLIDLFLFETKTKWVQKLNLFNEEAN